ncbi:MAG: DNA double-strand break repair nuclease NurA [Candidatus Marinimicrobia bacterium]|nr:DNA double-strand break repair nuclease NurA [Candidatus Neomarinimicrobiota bacterium]
MDLNNQNLNNFGDLPQALVDELLEKSQNVGKALFDSFKNVQNKRGIFRKQLKDSKLLKQESDFNISSPPTTCGVDGAYAKEELLSVDLLAGAAIALEGITPPSETRYWENPHHMVYIKEEIHNPDSNTILRGLMIGMEQILASKAPHDIVFIDGSLTTPLIYLNQAINKAELSKNKDLLITKALMKKLPEILSAYSKILSNTRTDKIWIGMPKYTSNREIGELMQWEKSYDDRALLTLLLNPGELTKPIDFSQPKQPWHLRFDSSKREVEQIIETLSTLKVIYYRPHTWTPALRVELNANAATNDYQIGMIIQAIKHQCSTSGIFEPYPLFLADRMAKSLGSGLPAFRQVVTRQMVEYYDGDAGEIFFSMHGYRTERSK